jgi:hypothetical protein
MTSQKPTEKAIVSPSKVNSLLHSLALIAHVFGISCASCRCVQLRQGALELCETVG